MPPPWCLFVFSRSKLLMKWFASPNPVAMCNYLRWTSLHRKWGQRQPSCFRSVSKMFFFCLFIFFFIFHSKCINNLFTCCCFFIVVLFAVRARDVEPEIACCLQDALRAAGLVNVQKKFVSVPFGEWGLEIGKDPFCLMFYWRCETDGNGAKSLANCFVCHITFGRSPLDGFDPNAGGFL